MDIKTLHAKIGQLTLANGFLESALTKVGLQLMIDRLHLEMPFAGSRMLRDLLSLKAVAAGTIKVLL